MKIAAIDYGLKRVGLAISDDLGMFAHPVPAIEANGINKQAEAVVAKLKELGAERVLVGLPKNMDGTEGSSARDARVFAEKLKAAFAGDVRLVDERLSTVEASRKLREGGVSAKKQRQGGRIDSGAAVVILQGHLDAAPPMSGP